MGYPGAHNIGIGLTWPNGFTNPPVVTNNINQEDSIEAGSTSIAWAFGSSQWPPDFDGVQILGIDFFTDVGKKVLYTSTDLFDNGFNFGQLNWVIPIKSSAKTTSDIRLYYDLKYKDKQFPSGFTWDPMIRIKPRG